MFSICLCLSLLCIGCYGIELNIIQPVLVEQKYHPSGLKQIKDMVAFQSKQGAEWSYSGSHGVDYWSDFFDSCNGSLQSPVDFNPSNTRKTGFRPFTFTNFDTVVNVTWTLTNNGHSAQVTYESGDLRVKGGGLPGDFRVAQFHFHWGHNGFVGSEHTVDGSHYPMEMHVVTYNLKYGNSLLAALTHHDGLAVLGVFFEVDSTNGPLQRVIKALGRVREPGATESIQPVPLEKLLPKDRTRFYRYRGSLTTPPCSEVVTWTVFQTPIRISKKQLDEFRHLEGAERQPMVDNFRPTQPLMGRNIEEN